MVSLRQKRCSNVYDDDITTDPTDDSDYEYTDTRSYQHNKNKGKIVDTSSKLNPSSMSIKKAKMNYPFSSPEYEKMSQTGRRQKCFSKNALMARENRIKKKMYVQDLEEKVEKFRDENKKLSSILDNQSSVITDLRKEVKYLKNVLANSTDIGSLLRCINQNTSMPVATSINNNIKLAAPVLNKKQHPWAEETQLQLNEFNNFEFDEINGEFTTLLSDFENDSKLDDLFSDITPPLANEDVSLPEVPSAVSQHLDHNYTNSLKKNENVGVCLHIAKHKVSLEFCSSCSENASTAWDED